MSLNPHQQLIQFVLEQADLQPVSKRIQLYRSLAEICGNEQTTTRLRQLADELEAAESHCREFIFNYQKGASK